MEIFRQIFTPKTVHRRVSRFYLVLLTERGKKYIEMACIFTKYIHQKSRKRTKAVK
jgi:hypothetical protein